MKTRKGSRQAPLYEAGNIFAKYYPGNDLSSDEEVKLDIKEMLRVYNILVYIEGLPVTSQHREDDYQDNYQGVEDLKRFTLHKRIERNQTLTKKVKKLKGYKCEACEFVFTSKYGEIGHEFIEAHHKVPLSQLTGQNVKLDANNDFYVLCSNCHRMIHKLNDPSDIGLLKRIIQGITDTLH